MKQKALRISTLFTALSLIYSTQVYSAKPPLLNARLDTPTQTQTLLGTLPGGSLGDNFGQAIYFSKDKLYISALLAQPDANKTTEGAVYVYQKHNHLWQPLQTITTNGQSDHLGAITIKTLDEWLFVSAIGTPIGPIPDDILANQNFMGSIQIYRFNGPTGQYEFYQALDSSTPGLENLTPCDPNVVSDDPKPGYMVEQGAAFGLSFDILEKQKVLVVGAATQMNNSLINSGDVYAFKYVGGQWKLFQTLQNPEGISANDTFGGIVKANRKFIAVSNAAVFSSIHAGSAPNTKVYLFRYNATKGQFQFVQSINGDQVGTTPFNSPNALEVTEIADNFGTSMAFNFDNLIVSAPFESLGTQYPRGAVYIYNLQQVNGSNQLVRQAKITSDESTGFLFGWGVNIDKYNAYIGDITHTGPSNDVAQGAAAWYKRRGQNWSFQQLLFDANGIAYDLLGGSVGVSKNFLGVGTARPIPVLYLSFFTTPALLSIPIPLNSDKTVLWERD